MIYFIKWNKLEFQLLSTRNIIYLNFQEYFSRNSGILERIQTEIFKNCNWSFLGKTKEKWKSRANAEQRRSVDHIWRGEKRRSALDASENMKKQNKTKTLWGELEEMFQLMLPGHCANSRVTRTHWGRCEILRLNINITAPIITWYQQQFFHSLIK